MHSRNAAARLRASLAVFAAAATACALPGCHGQASQTAAASRAAAYATLSSTDQTALADPPGAAQLLHSGTMPADAAMPKNPPLQPGLVVCSPVVSQGDKDLTDFGAGCAYWAQIVVGGLPELSGTPSFRGIMRSAAELDAPMLALTAQQAMQLKQTVAATYGAVGSLSPLQSSGQYTLSYRLIKTADGGEIGSPITLTGTEDEIIRQLPVLATELVSNLGLKRGSLTVPAPTLSSTAMQNCGLLRWEYQPDASLAQTLVPLATQFGNGFLEPSLLRDVSYPSASPEIDDVAVALGQLPDNADIFMEAATFAPESLPNVADEMKSDLARNPSNLQYATAFNKLARYTNAPAETQLAAAKLTLLADPLNADAWTIAGGTYADIANSIRQGKFSGEMSADESAEVARLYPYALGCYEHAALLDPLDESAWADVAEQASFNGNAAEADAALRHALHLGPNPVEAYSWGMQMYQDKWFGTQYPGKLQVLVDAACVDQSLSPGDLTGIAERSFGRGIQPTLYQQMMSAAKTHTAQGPQ